MVSFLETNKMKCLITTKQANKTQNIIRGISKGELRGLEHPLPKIFNS